MRRLILRPGTLTSPARAPLLRLVRLGVVGVFGLVVIGGTLLAARSEAAAEAAHLAAAHVVDAGAKAGLRLHQISVEGRSRTRGQDIVGAIGVGRGEALLAIDPAAARDRLQSLPWVKEAIVERRLPGTVHIRLVERTPIALWQVPGTEDPTAGARFVIVDADGVVVEDDISPFGHLPVIAGIGAPQTASDLFTLLAAQPTIHHRVKAAVRVSNRRWNVWLDAIGPGGIDIRLPEEDPAGALARLVEMDHDQALLRRDLGMIDLRLPDRLIVRANDAVVSGASAKGGPRPSTSSPPDLPLLRGPAEDA